VQRIAAHCAPAAATLTSRESLNLKESTRWTDRTQLAAGEIVGGTVLAAWLVKPDNGPVMIIWPDKPTAVSPRKYSETFAQITRVLANSSIELAAMRAKGAK
jgi:hypothetical protein